jgi:hypothetical protein
MIDNYQRNAEQSLQALAQLKYEQRALEQQIKDLQAKLTQHVLAGDLDHLKTDAENTYKFDEVNYVYSTGRVTYDFGDCSDVVAARENAKELEDTAKALGTAVQKIGTPFWTVRA